MDSFFGSRFFWKNHLCHKWNTAFNGYKKVVRLASNVLRSFSENADHTSICVLVWVRGCVCLSLVLNFRIVSLITVLLLLLHCYFISSQPNVHEKAIKIMHMKLLTGHMHQMVLNNTRKHHTHFFFAILLSSHLI